MSNYIVITDYEAKDNLLTGNPAKLIKGAEFTAEFNAVATAIASKADSLSPTLTTPNLGVATATSINKVTITAPATGSTLTVADGKTLTASNTLTLAGTDGTTMTFPSTSATIARTDAAQTFTGVQTFTSPAINGTIATTGLTLPALTLGGTVTSNGQSFSGTIANLGTVTTADINGGTLDGVVIGGTTRAAVSGTIGNFNNGLTVSGAAFTSRGITDNATATALTIDTSGNVGIGGAAITELLNLKGSNVGIRFEEPGGFDWRINNDAGTLNFSSDDPSAWSDKLSILNTGNVTPGADNTQNFGSGALRWATIYAGTGTINTSDEREKQDIAELDEAEKRVAVALKSKVKKFRFKDAVERKGDDARIHVGVIAQEVIAAFQAEGLDAMKYGIICYDEWEDKFVEHPAIEAVEAKEAILDEEGNIVEPAVEAVEGKEAWTEQTQFAGNRYGVRYEELLSFIIAAL